MLSHPPSILIVEADPVQRDTISLALRRNGYSSLSYCSGSEIGVSLDREHPDLLLLDINLPDRNGLDLLGELKREGFLKYVEVIVISSLGFPEVVKLTIDLGARDFLMKPLNIDLMIERVSRVLSITPQN